MILRNIWRSIVDNVLNNIFLFFPFSICAFACKISLKLSGFGRVGINGLKKDPTFRCGVTREGGDVPLKGY